MTGPALLEAGRDLSESYGLIELGDMDTPETPAWWLRELGQSLSDRRRRIEPLWERFKGRPPLPELGNPAASKARERVWKAFQRKARMNLEELVIRSIAERLTPIGTRVDRGEDTAEPSPVAPASAGGIADLLRSGARPTGRTGSAGDQRRNAVARRMWTGNRMAIQAKDIIEKFLVMGSSYAIVMAPEADTPDVPVVTAEDPRYVITYQDPARPNRTLAALKLYHDALRRRDVAWLYLPGRAMRLERANSAPGSSVLTPKRFRLNPAEWEITDDRDLSPWIGDRVAVVLFENHDGEGEFENHLDHLDRVNHMLLQRIVIATLQAFKQRAVKNVPTTDPKTGEKIDYSDIFTNDPGALWLLPGTAELWESGQVDLTGILSSVRDDVRDLAAVLRLPVQHFMPDAANGSAEGAAASKEGLVHRAEDRQTRADAGFGDVTDLGFGYLGVQGGDGAALPSGTAPGAGDPQVGAGESGPLTFTTLWRPIERFSLAERFDAASKANGILPWEMIMVDILGYEPDDLPRLRAARADDAVMAPAAAGESRAGATSGQTGAAPQPSSAGQSGGAGGQDRPAGGAGAPGSSSASTGSSGSRAT